MVLNIAFAGNRRISITVLEFLLGQGVKPKALIIPADADASHNAELTKLCSYLEPQFIIRGSDFKSKSTMTRLGDLNLDYLLSIHFPYIYPREFLEIPKHGAINLHPAFLPYNRGWNTASWAIVDGTPFGATLHVMSAAVDRGDIICQEKVEVAPDDTADILYKKALEAEFRVFKNSWPVLARKSYQRKPQAEKGTSHVKGELEMIQRLDMHSTATLGDTINRLRALTTNRIDDAAYFEQNGTRYRVQIRIEKEG